MPLVHGNIVGLAVLILVLVLLASVVALDVVLVHARAVVGLVGVLLLPHPHVPPALVRRLELLHLLVGGRRRLEDLGRSLRDSPPPSDSLGLLDLDLLVGFLPVLLAKPFVFFVNIQNKLLDVGASNLVLVIEPRADAQMQGLIRLLLPRTFLKPRPFPSEPELDDFLELVVARALAAYFDDPFHVTPLGSN